MVQTLWKILGIFNFLSPGIFFWPRSVQILLEARSWTWQIPDCLADRRLIERPILDQWCNSKQRTPEIICAFLWIAPLYWLTDLKDKPRKWVGFEGAVQINVPPKVDVRTAPVKNMNLCQDTESDYSENPSKKSKEAPARSFLETK